MENSRFFENLPKIAWQLLQLQFFVVAFLPTFCIQNMRQRSDLQACRKRGTTVQQWYCVKAVSSPPKTKPRSSSLHHCIIARARAGEKMRLFHGFSQKCLNRAPRSSVSTKSRSSQRRTWQTRSKAEKINQLTAEGFSGQRCLYPICYSLDVGRLNAQTSQPEVLIGSMAIPRFSKSNIRFKLPTFVKLQAHESLSTFNNTHIMYVSYP